MPLDKASLKLLSSNPSGLRALLDYLEGLKTQYDTEFTTTARQLVFSQDARDAALIVHGKVMACDELIRTINSMTSINRGV
jgi:hypothetical protein